MRNGLSKDLIARVLGGAPKYTLEELENQFQGRKYIFTLIQDYHRYDKYVFGGIFEVKERLEDCYSVSLSDVFSSLIGRLVVDYHQGQRQMRRKFEEVIDDFYVSEILNKAYAGVDFPGYENINIDFTSLEFIINNQKQDWKVALENMKGYG